MVAAAIGAVVLGAAALTPMTAQAQAVPGGTLDPLTIPKYVTPLVIPPVMKNNGTANQYDIAVRQFQQQILPSPLPPTTVWSYGPATDSVTGLIAPSSASQFNYPAYTVENTVNATTMVNWINDLKDASGNFLPHLLPIDRSLHWANPEQLPCMTKKAGKLTDCRPDPTDPVNVAVLQQPYDGPVPIITHVHGAHVGPESDGYPEAWFLPAANNIPAGYATEGFLANKYGGAPNTANGVASFSYPNTQPSTTLWYHDHTLGMTRSNVYAGPAGFWLIREQGGGETGLAAGSVLPGPAPVAGQGVLALNVPGDPVRNAVREIPIVIQDRSFNADGSLFYPANRAFFEGLGTGANADNVAAGLNIPFSGDPTRPSDIAPIWNPEAFFNVMVVNGVSWPNLEVAPALYRFRLLNGSNSRFLNLSLKPVDPISGKTVNIKKTVWVASKNGKLKSKSETVTELPFFQIGADQSLMPQVAMIATGTATPLPGNGIIPKPVKAANADQALLMGLAERADVLVDFRGLPNGTVIQMFNTAPDAPFGGFPDIPADPATTGQVMRFVVNSGLLGMSPTDEVRDATGLITQAGATSPESLVLTLPDSIDPANGPIQATVRDMALLEEESALVCATISPAGAITYDATGVPDPANPGTCTTGVGGPLAASVPFAPKAAVLGTNGSTAPVVTLWSDPIATNPALNATETWELWNWTVDGHPIHMHLVKFKVVNRQAFDPLTGALIGAATPPEITEAGWKDTVISYPGAVTRVNATFDIPGLYVWHCHIVEHEDNEMMVPYCVGDSTNSACQAAGI